MKAAAAEVLIAIFLLSVVALSSTPRSTLHNANKQRAKELWEQAITAKGGRERLYKVHSLLVTYGTKHKTVSFCAFPDKYWLWDDSRPSPLGLSLSMYNLEKGVGYVIMGDTKSPEKQKNTRYGSEALLRHQLMYLMETPWVKPIPFDAREATLNGKPVDVVYAWVNNRKVSYTLDKATHLPLRFETYVLLERRRLPTGHILPAEESSLPRDFWDFVEVNGVKLPSKVRYHPDTPFIHQTYLINVEYDGRLFERPPSIEDGSNAWHPRPKP